MGRTPIEELREWHERHVNDWGEPYVTRDELRELDLIIRRLEEEWRSLDRRSCDGMLGGHVCQH